METSKLPEKIKEARAQSKKRKFLQSFDLVVNLKDIDLKKTESQFEDIVVLPGGRGKKLKIAAIVDKELGAEAQKNCSLVLLRENFAKIKAEPKKIKKYAAENDVFIAQANIMPEIAAVFGRYLAPRNKMPNPKAGCVVPPTAKLEPVIQRLNNVVIVKVKKSKSVQVPVGTEDSKDEDIAKNIIAVYDSLRRHLQRPDQQIRSVLLKTTMGKTVKLE